jgi:AcrR family transcriptional regulator
VNLEATSLAKKLSAKRSEMLASEVEGVALRLFEQRGFANVTVDDIAIDAHISARTFYRHFPAKEDVLQVRIARRSSELRMALSRRPDDEPPLQSLRLSFASVVSADDLALHRRWIATILETPSVLKGVLGGIQLKTQPVIAEFLGTRLALQSDALVPTMLAAAAVGVIQAAHARWFFDGGDLAAIVSESLEVLETGIGRDPDLWSVGQGRRQSSESDRAGRRRKTTGRDSG